MQVMTIKGRQQKIKINNAAHCSFVTKVLVVLYVCDRRHYSSTNAPWFLVIGLTVNRKWVPSHQK